MAVDALETGSSAHLLEKVKMIYQIIFDGWMTCAITGHDHMLVDLGVFEVKYLFLQILGQI